MRSGSLTVTDSIFVDNKASNGYSAGIHATDACEFLSVSDCTFNNSRIAHWGAAISFYCPGLVNNCEFYNGHAGLGGGAILIQSESVTVNNSVFENNYGRDGSAIIMVFSGLGNEILNCNFTNNTGESAGAIYVRYDSGNNIIDSCLFVNNTLNAQNGGGAAILLSTNENGGNNIVKDSIFIDNKANNTEGGAIKIDSLLNQIINCTFYNNTDKNGQDSIVSQKPVLIENITIDDNSTDDIENLTINEIFYISADGNGTGQNSSDCTNWTYAYENISAGGTICLTNGTYTDIINVTVAKPINIIGMDNAVLDLNNNGYAFIVSSSGVNITNLEIKNGLTSVEDAGAIIFADAGSLYSQVINCTFINNTGVLYNDIYAGHQSRPYRNTKLINNTFYGSYIPDFPKIYIGGDNVPLKVTPSNEDITVNVLVDGEKVNEFVIPCNFTDYVSISFDNLTDYTIYTLNISFTNNTDNYYCNSESYTFVYMDSWDSVYISYNGTGSQTGIDQDNTLSFDEFEKLINTFKTIYLVGEFENVTLDVDVEEIYGINATLTNTTWKISNVNVNNVAFTDLVFFSRIAEDWVLPKNITFNDCNITDLNFYQGTPWRNLHNFTFNRCNIENVDTGGNFKHYVNFVYDQCNITNFHLSYTNVAFNNLFFLNSNISDSYMEIWRAAGDSIYNITMSNVNFSKSRLYILSNEGTFHGLNINNCNFIDSSSSERGAAIHFDTRGNISITNCTFVNSVSSNSAGGAICNMASNAIIANCTFVNSTSKTNGGTIYNTGSNTLIINCTFVNSTAQSTGGSVYNTGLGTLIANCTFVNSTAQSTGGAIYTNAKADIINNAFIAANGTNPSNKNSGIYDTASSNIQYNWYGNNTPDLISIQRKNSTYLKAAFDKVYDSLITGEWNGVLDVYFVKNDADERVDVAWARPVNYNVTTNNADVKDEFTNVHAKLYTNDVGERIAVTAKVDNQELGELEFGATDRRGFTELQNLIDGADPYETLILSNNYAYDSENDGDLIAGISINKPVTIVGNISGSDVAKRVFNIISDNVTLENMTIENVNGTAIMAIGDNLQINDMAALYIKGNVMVVMGDNAQINDLFAANVNGDVLKIMGDNAQINNLFAANVKGDVINVVGDDASIDDVSLPGYGGVAVNVTGDNAKVTNINIAIVPGENVIVEGNININIIADDIVYPDNAVIYVNADVDGTYTLKVNDEEYNITVKNGIASKTLDVLEPGTYDVIVIGQFGEESPISNATANFTVVSIDIPEIVEDEITELPVVLPSDATGNVSVSVDGETVDTRELVNGSVVLEIPPLEAGDHNITVSYSGNDEHAALNQTSQVRVKKNTDANVTVPEILENTSDEISVELPSDATGNVTLIVDGETVDTKELVNGSAVLEIPPLEAGDHNITVAYPGDENYTGFNQTSQITAKIDGDFNVTVPEFYENKTAEISVDLPEDATGNVILMIDDEVVDSKEIVNGSAVFEIPVLEKGDHNITVSYLGDDKYASQNEEFNITLGDDLVVKAENLTKYYSASDKFIINVTDSEGNPLFNKTVQITLNGKTYTKHTDERGLVSMDISLTSGEYETTVTVDNVTLNRTVTILSTVNGSDIVKMYRNETQYYITLRDSNGTSLPEGSEVEFNINGIKYTRKTDENGTAKLNINLPEGNYTITAYNAETGESCSNNITVLSRIISEDIVKYYRNDTQYRVTILGDDGNPVGAGVDVVFNINGVLYKRSTNADGVAKLNINLPTGNYTITVTEYSGCVASNNIEVLPVLTADNLTKDYGSEDQFVVTVLDSQGNINPNQTVTFNINGVLYKRVSDANGQAKLNINLPKGEYIITSSYNNANIANKITIV